MKIKWRAVQYVLADLVRGGDALRAQLAELLDYHNFQLTQYYGVEAVKLDDVIALCDQWREVIAPLVVDVTTEIR